jgi:hypothetical protein
MRGFYESEEELEDLPDITIEDSEKPCLGFYLST